MAKKQKAAQKKAAVKKAAPKKAAPVPVTRAAFAAADEGTIATVHVEFDNVNAGNSECLVTHNNENPQTLTQSGSVSFDNVMIGDTLEVDGISAGKTTITVSGANRFPVQMVFASGQQISGFFRIIS